MAEQSDQDINGGDRAAHAGTVHVGEDGTDEVEAVGGDRIGEDEEEAGVGEGVMAEIGGN